MALLKVVNFLVQQYPDSLKEKDNQEKLPLHYACENNAPPQVLEFMVQQYPDSVMEKDKDDLLPLHYACDKDAPLQVLEFLVQQYPDALLCLDLELVYCQFHCFGFMLFTTLQG